MTWPACRFISRRRFNRETGSLSGKITKNGAGIFGAHVVATNLRTGKMVGYVHARSERDVRHRRPRARPCVVRAEPLDDGDIESFFDRTANVELGFLVTYAERLAIVPSAGNAANIDIAVRPK